MLVFFCVVEGYPAEYIVHIYNPCLSPPPEQSCCLLKYVLVYDLFFKPSKHLVPVTQKPQRLQIAYIHGTSPISPLNVSYLFKKTRVASQK